MYQDFDKMPLQSRVWIYQADRTITANEENKASYFLKEAIEKWAAHGATLVASAEILHSRFIIIALDENQNAASGCSIDASTHWVKELGAELGIDFFDRSLAFETETEINTVPIFKAKPAIEAGLIKPDTFVFNNNIMKLQELKSVWRIQAAEYLFLKRHFKAELA